MGFNEKLWADTRRNTEEIENMKPQIVDLCLTIPTTFGYIGTNGAIANNEDVNWLKTDFVDITPYKDSTFDINMFGHSVISSLSFYDSEQVFISGNSALSASTYLVKTVNVPETAKYFKLSYGSNGVIEIDLGSTCIVTKIGIINVVEIIENVISPKWKGKKIALAGDSISSTDYPWYKSSLETKTEATVGNIGQSGASTATIASNAYFANVISFDPDLTLYLVGGNDEGDANSVGTFFSTSPNGILGEPVVLETDIGVDYNGTKFVQAISHIIRKYKSQFYNFRENANLIGTETEEEKTTKIDAVKKPKIVFCTTLPQKRNNASDGFSIEQNWIRKVNAVKECCLKYDIPMLDLYELCRWDMSLEPYWVGPTNMTTNNGIYTMDGLHPNKYGYEDMAVIVNDFINGI